MSKCLSAVCHCFIVLIWLCKIYSPAITMRVIASALATVLPISSNYIALKCANFQRNMDLWDFYHSYSNIDSVTSQSTIIRTTSFIDTILMMCIRCGTIRALDRRMNGRTRTEVLCQDRASVILSMLTCNGNVVIWKFECTSKIWNKPVRYWCWLVCSFQIWLEWDVGLTRRRCFIVFR